MEFEFITTPRIIFGPGTFKQVGSLAAELGQRALVVTSSAGKRARSLLDALAVRGLEVIPFVVSGEPTVEVVQQGTQQARVENCDLVIGFGGWQRFGYSQGCGHSANQSRRTTRLFGSDWTRSVVA